MNTKRALVLGFSVVVVVVAALSASMVMANAEYDPHSGEMWHSDLEAGQQAAQTSGEPLLLYFWSEDCSYCKEFNAELQNNAALQESVDGYVLVSVEYVNEPELRSEYDVSGTPTIVVLSPDGEMVTSFVPTSVQDPAGRLDQAHDTAVQ